MKIGFIYSGLSRTLVDSIRQLNNKITCPSIQYDIYVYTELNEIDSSYLHKKIRIEDLYSLDNVKSILIDTIPQCPYIYKTDKEKSMYYQWYKMNRIYSIISSPHIYDYIIRIRSDLFILEDLDTILLNIASEKAYNKVYIPYGNNIYDSRHTTTTESMNDQFAIGIPSIMKIYTNLINDLVTYITPDTCSEIVLAKHLKKYNIQVNRFKFDCKLVLSLCNVIGISGNSGSGKSTITNIIEKIFKFDKKITLETDRYHKWERGHFEWNSKTHLNPESNYLEKLQEDTFNLKLGNDIFVVDYDHSTGKFTPSEKVEAKENIVLCGLHTLYHNKLRDIIDIKVYIDTQESLQYYWKLKRDVTERGHTVEKVINSIENRKEDYAKYIHPQKEYSDIIIQFYTESDINMNEWDTIQLPNILLKIHMRYTMYNILRDHLSYFTNYISIHSYTSNFIIVNVTNNINNREIYKYITANGIDFIDIDDIHCGYYGVIQLIFALLLYK
jgi:uridine kinase